MKKSILAIALALLTLPAIGFSATGSGTTPKAEFGLDAEMPLIFLVDGESDTERGETLIGIHGNYFVNPNWSLGMQFDFGVESGNTVADNPLYLTPGAAYYFSPENTWNPYVRFDVPVLLNNDFGIGASAGIGLHWNLSEATGVDGLGLKGDTALNWMYLTDASIQTLGWNILRLALVYNW